MVSHTVRATFTAWHDRVIAGLMLIAALVAVHAGFADRPWTIAAWAALIAGAMIGIGVGCLIATRLAFHAFDGLLAADALHKPTRQRYMAAWHGIGLGLLVALTLIARPSLMVVSLPAYLVGAVIAELTGGFVIPKHITGTIRPGWTLRTWLHRPIAGVAAAMILLLSLLPARALGMNALMAVAGIGTVLLALMLTHVDDAIVRFMTIAGNGSRRVIARHTGGIVTFLIVSVPGCWLLLGTVAAGIVVATGAAMLLLLSVRVLAYRLHGKRFADFFVSMLMSLLMLVAYSMPVALPVIAFALLWQLQRRGQAKTWLLA